MKVVSIPAEDGEHLTLNDGQLCASDDISGESDFLEQVSLPIVDQKCSHWD
jgi:hypothetical protein